MKTLFLFFYVIIISGLIAVPIAQADKPNIVVILLDDVDETTTPYWRVLTKTKQLIADQGTVFTNSFAPSSVCCPARASILTGLYAHNTGVWNVAGEMGGWVAFTSPTNPDGTSMGINNEDRTIAVMLQKAGYRTGVIGKYFNGMDDDVEHVGPGWNEWYVGHSDFYAGYDYTLTEYRDDRDPNPSDDIRPSTLVKYGSTEADYSTDVVSKKAVDFIQRAGSTPFFLYVTPTAAHQPLPPAKRHEAQAAIWKDPANQPYKTRVNFKEADVSDKSLQIQSIVKVESLLAGKYTDHDYYNRMGSLYAADDLVDAVMKTLEQTGKLKNTFVFFASDNGYQLGAHGLVAKGFPYEESIRVPLAVSGPGVRAGTSETFVTQCDFAPTFMQLAGETIPAEFDGRSLVTHFSAGTTPAWTRSDFILRISPIKKRGSLALSESLSDEVTKIATLEGAYFPSLAKFPELLPGLRAIASTSYRALRSKDALYVEFDASGSLPKAYEFYDLEKDPYELSNLLRSSSSAAPYKKSIARMRTRLDALSACKGKDCW